MKNNWETKGRTLDRRAEEQLKIREIPLRRRIDVILFTGIAAVFVIFALLWAIGVLVGGGVGLFDKPPIRPIADERILTNVRDDLQKKPLLDAVQHREDHRIYISQTGGTVHGYHPATGLWKSEKPFSKDQLLAPDLVMLRSGSGADILSDPAGQNPDPGSLWGLSANHGLVRRFDGQWRTVIGDTLFSGPQGTPVKSGQLTAAAVSPDGKWLVVGTSSEGAGIYHLETRRWIPIKSDIARALPSHTVTHAAWWNNRFWIGGPSGLVSIEIENRTPRLHNKPAITGHIMDLDVDKKNRLWVLEKRNCLETGIGCIRLSRLNNLLDPPQRLVDEQNIYPQLNPGDLFFAQYWDNRLLAAGHNGVFSYDTTLHSWQRHFKGAVLSVLPLPGGEGFYYGYTGGIGALIKDRYVPWENPDKKNMTWPMEDRTARIEKLRFGRGGRGSDRDEILGVTRSGNVFALENGKTASVFGGGYTSLKPDDFHSAFNFGNNVLFVSEHGALIHDIVARTYKDVPSASLPEWLLRPDVQILSSGDNAYIASPKDGDTEIYQVPRAMINAGLIKAVKLLELVRGPVGKLRNWGGRGMVVIAGARDGRVLRFDPALEVLVGGDPSGFTSDMLDVAPYKNGLMAATSIGLRHYDYLSRSWTDHGNPPGSVPVEMAPFNGPLLTVTADGRLFKWDEGTRYTPLIGVQRGFDIRDAGLSDVKEKDGKLYLAGSGKVYLYHPDTRQINGRWDLPGTGRVSLKGFIGTEPLALCGNRATVGKRVIDPAAGAVINLSRDNNFIWTVRQSKGERYLKRYPVTLPSLTGGESFFRGAGAGKGTTKILDAVSLPKSPGDSTGENIAVLTDDGLRFYSTEARSWYNSYPSAWIPYGERLYLMDGFLVVVGREKTDYGITFAPLDKINIPPGISGKPVSFETKPQRVFANAFAVDPQGGRAAFIEKKGRTVEWKAGAIKEILPAPGRAPETGILRRVFDRVTGNRGSLLLTTRDAVHRYDLQKRSWREIQLNVPSSDDIDIRREGAEEVVTVKTMGGAYFMGRFKPSEDPARTVRIPMKQVFSPAAGFAAGGDRLLDVQQREDRDGGWWTFLLDDRIKYFNPEKREWVDNVLLRGISGTQTFHSVGNRGVLVDDGGRTWWVARQTESHPRNFARYRLQPAQTTALDENGTVWRLTTEGKLFKQPCPARGDYPADSGTLHEEPFIISPGDVKKAFKWKNMIVFDLGDRLRLLDATRGEEISLPRGGRGFTGIRDALIWNNRMWLRTAGGVLVLRRKSDRSVEATALETGGSWPARVQNARGKQTLKDSWSQLSQKTARLPDGKTAYDPITRLTIGTGGELSARRPGGNETLAARGVIDFDGASMPPSLDAGWLKWDRVRKDFKIETPGGKITLNRNDVVRDGRLIFEDVDGLLVMGKSGIYTANRHGIWRFSREDLSLTDSSVTFRPMQWGPVTGAAHGYFISGGRLYNGDGGTVSVSLNTHRVRVGDVVVSEDIPGRRVGARVLRDGTAVNAFSDYGFTWDRRKRGIFYGSPTGLLVHSDAGVHPARRYTDFKGELNAHPVLPGQDWTGKPDSGKRTLVDNVVWTWVKQNGTVSIRLKEKPYDLKTLVGRSGFGFSSDRLVDALVIQNKLVVMTEAFFETADPASRYGSFRASRFPSKPTTALDRMGDASGRENLFLFSRAGNFYWDEPSTRFKAATGPNDPSRERLIARVPVNKPFLRFSGRRGGAVKKEVRVNHIDSGESWVSFSFIRGRFPFDVVTAAAADSRRFYVGTAAGLLVSSGSSGKPNAGLGQMELLDLRRRSSGPLQAVTKVGIPANTPGLVIARSRGLSIQCAKDGGGDFMTCPNPGLLDTRLRVETGFWRFEDRQGSLYGRYKDETGKLSSARIASYLGLFPHDHLSDIVVFDDRVFTLWQDGWVTIHPGLSMELTRGVVNTNLRNRDPRRFILIPEDVPPGLPGLPPVTLPRGVYIQGRDRILHYSGGKWDPVKQSALRTGIVGYADRPPVVHRKNLVLSQPDLRFKRRRRDGGWHVMPWKDGRLTMDRWTDLFYLGDQLWAATGEGLVTFTRDAEDRIVLDPDNFIVVREPGDDLDIPQVTDVEVDNAHNQVTLRCEASSNQVYRGTLTLPLQAGPGIFQALSSDPFAEREMVSEEESGFWEWHLKGRRDRGPGWLEGRFLGEQIRLFSGRFEFDTFHSLAFIEPDRVEIATDSGGWYRTAVEAPGTVNTLDVGDLVRPGVPDIDFTAIKGVLITGEGDQRLLGLFTADGEYIRWRRGVSPQKTKGCPEFLGNDGFWRYEKSGGNLVISAPGSKGGKALRTIRGGRFTDDIVTGLPVTGEVDGGIYYLVPTEGGVLGFGGDLGLREIHAGPFPGLKADEVPSVLFMESGGAPLYLSGDGLRFLGGSRDIFPELKIPVPKGVVVTAVEEGPQAFIRARWKMKDNGRRGWSLSRGGNTGDSGRDTFYVNVSGFDKFIKNQETWGYPGPWMQVLLKTERMEVYRPGESLTYSLDFPATVDLLSPVVVGETLYLIGERTLFEINLEHVMIKSFDPAARGAY